MLNGHINCESQKFYGPKMTLDVNGSLEFFEGFAQKFYKMEQYAWGYNRLGFEIIQVTNLLFH